MDLKDKLDSWNKQIEQAQQYGLYFDWQTVREIVETVMEQEIMINMHYEFEDEDEKTKQRLCDQIDIYIDALREIDTHIRSTPEPVTYIIQTLQNTLPEYKGEVITFTEWFDSNHETKWEIYGQWVLAAELIDLTHEYEEWCDKNKQKPVWNG